MAETPISEDYPTRFSTPVSELDDHRRQSACLPLVTGYEVDHEKRTRSGTLRSIAAERPDIQIMSSNINMSATAGIAVDDHAIEDKIDNDEKMEKSNKERRLSSAAPTAGAETSAPQVHEQKNRSRTSSTSSRADSPPNSVEAFADSRRRERAGTVVSDASSDLDLDLRRTGSGRPRSRRPTFSEVKSVDIANDASSRRSLAEEDVCFPQLGERGLSYTVDFEELGEFVAEYDKYNKTPIPQFNSLKNVDKRPKIFRDLRQRSDVQTVPQLSADLESYSFRGETEKAKYDQTEKNGLSDEFGPGRPSSIKEGVNRWTFFSSEMDNSVHATELGDLLMPGESFRDLFELPPDGGVWWLDMFKPTEEEVTAICKAFKVHPLTKEDICTQETREKVELFKSYYFVCFTSFIVDKDSDDFLEPVNVYAVVFREGLLTFTFSHNPHAANVRKRIGRLRDYLSLGADWICYALM